ncbi:hypothetical protein, partial [Victivallis vadensis]|uniref:hypothetical protein n=1 Tax=Victivallis vadensis TaxID=172901 RepID=UPI003AF6257A
GSAFSASLNRHLQHVYGWNLDFAYQGTTDYALQKFNKRGTGDTRWALLWKSPGDLAMLLDNRQKDLVDGTPRNHGYLKFSYTKTIRPWVVHGSNAVNILYVGGNAASAGVGTVEAISPNAFDFAYGAAGW